jgi:predicted heme/steroid binding protein
MSSLLSHPINPVLLLCLLHALQRILFPITAVPRTLPTECKAGYSWMPRRHTPTLRFTTYTPRTLAKFNGHDGRRILFAIAGIVFDVTGGKGFYGPGEHLVTFFFDLLEHRGGARWLTGLFKMGCTGALRDGMHRGV